MLRFRQELFTIQLRVSSSTPLELISFPGFVTGNDHGVERHEKYNAG